MVDVTKRPITDEELKVLVDAEIESALGYMSSDLADERSTAMDRYLGEPLGTEMEGRSQANARDVMETIEWIMPTLIEIFTANDRAVEFLPTGPEDEEQAEQEADYLNHLLYQKQDGFLILYSWFKDALLQKNGISKTYAEEFDKVTKESYKNLLDNEYKALLADDEYEIEEHESKKGTIQTPQGPVEVNTHNVTLKHTEDDVRYITDILPPEEFLISKDAKSVDPTKARFCAHITTKTVSEMREMGFDDEALMQMELGENEVELSEEKISRMNLSDEERWDDSVTLNTGMRKVKLKECYVYADKDGDGVTELLKILRSGTFIDVEEIDYHPFGALTPNILTHKFFGYSIPDMMQDIQELRTMLLRSYFDNINQTINGTTYYDENTVNIDDMLTSKPFGNRSVDGSPVQSVLHIPPSGLPPEAFTLNELLDKFLTSRVGDFQSQLDPNVLAQANTGVVLKMLAEAKGKVLMIARIFAEVGMKPLFRTYHHLVRKHSEKEDIFKLRNNWIPVDPREWKERTNMTVKVGLGTQDNQEQIANLNGIFQNQMQAMQLGLPVVTPQNIHATLSEIAEKMGQAPEKFFTPPEQIPPPPEKQDPQMALIQAQMKIESDKAQLKSQELRIKAAQVTSDAQLDQQKAQLETIKAEQKRIESISQGEKDLLAAQLKRREVEQQENADAAKAAITMSTHESEQMLEKYKADLAAAVEMAKAGIKADPEALKSIGIDVSDLAVENALRESEERSQETIRKLTNTINDFQDEQAQEQEVIYDDDGRILSVGKKRVERDGSGNLVRIVKQ